MLVQGCSFHIGTPFEYLTSSCILSYTALVIQVALPERPVNLAHSLLLVQSRLDRYFHGLQFERYAIDLYQSLRHVSK